MIVFYDFDGTLTPYPIPQYEIISKCNMDYEAFYNRVIEITQKMHLSIYEAYYDVFKDVLMENGFKFNKDVISLGAEDVIYSNGVKEFIPALKIMGIKQYVITSGYKDYVLKTPVAKYLDGVEGAEFKDDNNDGKIDKILTDQDKVTYIKEICAKENTNYSDVIYIGDGLTDKDAFTFVHQNGGKTIFVGDQNAEFEALNAYKVIDKVFARDFSLDAPLFAYIESCYKKEV